MKEKMNKPTFKVLHYENLNYPKNHCPAHNINFCLTFLTRVQTKPTSDILFFMIMAEFGIKKKL